MSCADDSVVMREEVETSRSPQVSPHWLRSRGRDMLGQTAWLLA